MQVIKNIDCSAIVVEESNFVFCIFRSDVLCSCQSPLGQKARHKHLFLVTVSYVLLTMDITVPARSRSRNLGFVSVFPILNTLNSVLTQLEPDKLIYLLSVIPTEE